MSSPIYSAATPRFWANPLRYCRWAARERPAYFWSVVIGAMGPVTLATVPPLRRRLGDEDAPPIPLTYPGASFFFSLSLIFPFPFALVTYFFLKKNKKRNKLTGNKKNINSAHRSEEEVDRVR